MCPTVWVMVMDTGATRSLWSRYVEAVYVGSVYVGGDVSLN